MQNKKISFYIWHFVKLNPKRNQKPCINKYHQNSFFVIKRIFKENKKYITASNYDDIFYNKYEQMQGKKWLAILLSSKNIFEYHKKIRDEFPYCKQRKFIKMLLNDFDYFFDNKDIQNVIIDIWTNNFNFEIKKYLEKILKFLDEEEWSIYFFELQKLMHEQIFKLLDWKGDFTYEKYNKVLISKLNSILSKDLSEYYLIFVQKVNLYRNTFSKIKPSENQQNQQLLNNWNNLTNQMKHIEAKHIYNQLLDFIDIINLILNKKSL